MKLSKRTVGVIITLMVLSLAGLVALQASLLNNAMDQKEQAFRRNVQAALGQVANRVATQEAFRWATRPRQLNSGGGVFSSQYHYRFETKGADWVGQDVSTEVFVVAPDNPEGTYRKIAGAGEHEELPRIEIQDTCVVFFMPTPQHVLLQAYNPERGSADTLLDAFRTAGEHVVRFDSARFGSGSFIWKLVTDSSHIVLNNLDRDFPALEETTMEVKTEIDGSPDSGRQILVQAMLNRLAFSEIEPLQARLDSLVLDSLIAQSLNENGIDLAHAYGVTGYGADTLTIARPAVYRPELTASPFRASLFPHDVFAQPTDLVLYFPDHRTYLWGEIAPMLTASIVLTLIIIGCFAYTIRTIFAQRRFSGRLVDFINNMTHEFKTPISTVALAAEAIDRPDVVEDREKVLRFNEMIRTENRRMRTQVDKILQMAVLEEGDYDLDKEPVDLHEVIEQAVAGFALKIESRGGRLETSLQADQATVYGDTVHLTNIIYNLLDNANKYTPDGPHIKVRTQSRKSGIEISISDNGIGIKAEDREYVFDKYFRVPSGNVHDVKGFGIGLSYVHMMVKAHGGSIRLDSEVGKGTTVTITLPTTATGKG